MPVDAATPLSVCVRTGQEIVLTRAQMIQRFPDLAAATAGTGSTLLAAMPLLVGGSTLGALLLAFRGPVDADQLDLPLLRAVATQSAQALDRARLIGRLGEVAEHLQSAMEPDRLPSVPGFELASVYRPGGDELEHVGGDWFDLVELDEGRYAFSIGDVMGRGVLASTTMTRIRTAMRAYASVDGAPLAVVTTLDRFARTEAPDDFVTLVYGVLDAATGDVRLVNAGHLPPVLAGLDGTARLVDDEASVPLGLHGCRVEAELQLAPGATLLLFTDGLVERRDRGIDEGLTALLDAVRRTGARVPLEERLQVVVEMMTADGAADDDVTALMIRREGTP